MGAAALLSLAGCVRIIDGSATPGGRPDASSAQQPGWRHGKSAPGVEPTLRQRIPPSAFVCFPGPGGSGIGTVAQVHDTAAPRITITLPDGWTGEPGQRDRALTLSGPAGMRGAVTIAATRLDPGRAFSDYAAALAHSKSEFRVETRGAKFCGYSSQKLFGTFTDDTGTVEFADRLAHIWTNTADYLVAIHVEGPKDAPGFRGAKTTLTQDFAVVIP